jgi:hypothetical protein
VPDSADPFSFPLPTPIVVPETRGWHASTPPARCIQRECMMSSLAGMTVWIMIAVRGRGIGVIDRFWAHTPPPQLDRHHIAPLPPRPSGAGGHRPHIALLSDICRHHSDV